MPTVKAVAGFIEAMNCVSNGVNPSVHDAVDLICSPRLSSQYDAGLAGERLRGSHLGMVADSYPDFFQTGFSVARRAYYFEYPGPATRCQSRYSATGVSDT